MVPKNSIVLGVEHGVEIAQNGPSFIIINIQDECRNDRGRCAFRRTRECIRDAQSASQELSLESDKASRVIWWYNSSMKNVVLNAKAGSYDLPPRLTPWR